MLLKSIKLVGFKSFVDPTLVPIRSRLNAIVGPNGCGKSNVVDAIRWVVGEMSAKQLRGQSMSDVIFNGTKDRPSVGRASIELLFDNQAGRLGGPYAAYNEFAIRREIAREGISNYFINGTACRRRDIVDVFLGTGLGSQSYAIIEQGMIARLVEAKPDELRTYLEEAAGISKYKDRRRETETRMRQTKDNLERLNDLLDELMKQQRHLKRQSNAAERYKSLKDKERYLTAQIKALQWQVLEQQLQQAKEHLKVHLTSSDQNTSAQRALEARLEKERLSRNDAQRVLNQVQQKYYQFNTDIARFEEQIHHIQQQKTQWTAELNQTRTLKENLAHQMSLQQKQIEELTQQVSHAEPTLLEKRRLADQAKQQLQNKEVDMRAFQETQETFRLEFQQVLRERDITQTKLTHYQARIRQIEERLIKLKTQDVHQTLEALQNTEKPLTSDVQGMQTKLGQVNQELSVISSDIQTKKLKKVDLAKQRQSDEKTLYEKKRCLAVLEGLQAAAFGHNNETLKNWLKKHQLIQYQRLAQCIQVDSHWEKAAEIVLQDFFDALCVQSIESYHDLLHAFPEGRLTLIEKTKIVESSHALSYETLNTKIQSNGLIDGVLKNIYLAKNLLEAYKIRSQLKHGQSVITKEGVWLGQNWVRLFKVSTQKENILSREKKLKQLSAQVLEIEEVMEKLADDISKNDAAVLQLESRRDELNSSQRILHTQLATIQAKLSEQKLRLSELERQQTRWIREKEDNEKELTTLKEELSKAKIQLSVLEKHHAEGMQRKSELELTKNKLDRDLSLLREEAMLTNRQLDAVAVRLEGQRNELTVLNQSTAQAEQQVAHLTKKQSELEVSLSSDDSPIEEIQTKLQLTLKERVSLETELTDVRGRFDTHEKNIGELKADVQKVLTQVTNAQSEMQEIRMTIQRMTLEQAHLVEQIQKVNCDVKKICEELPAEVLEETLKEQLEKNQLRITRLGPINLAAIHEHEEVSKRRNYLEAQKDDLVKALDLLKEAISKVDKETRERFKQTFDAVNENFSNLFPRIFDGGHAELQLTENDLLTAGVTVRAQPPGKRNTSIHLLSGGEKTLAAIGLVFALFELNPAPFCILDEVDAPLDDINVSRFCQLLQEMSDKTQFLIITHNKVTMEMADVLMGVTMQEAGVSRVVSVTMEDAIKYAQSSGQRAQDA